MNSKITVRPHAKKLHHLDQHNIVGINETYQDCQASRSTEDDALSHLGSVPELTSVHRRIAELEKMGRDPRYWPEADVIDRRPRAIFGWALWSWISIQQGVKMSATEVREWLDDVERICEARAAAGLDVGRGLSARH